MQSIADAAGCSRMTVSLALRNSPDISEKTRTHIHKIAEELGYRVNPLVSTLMAQRATRKEKSDPIPIALINTYTDFDQFLGVEFYNQVLNGIHRRTKQLGFYAEIFDLDPSNKNGPAQLDRILHTRGIRGVIILPLSNPDYTFCLDWAQYSTATIAHTWHGDPVHRASHDLFGSASLLMNKLIQRGYRRPGLFTKIWIHVRTRGIEAAAYYLFQHEHPEITPIPLFMGTESTTQSEIEKWIRQHKPDVIIGHGDLTRTLDQLKPALRRTFDYAELNLMPSQIGRLAGVSPQPDIIGEQAVDLVISRLHRNEFGLSEHPRMTMTSGIWHDGASLPAYSNV